MQLLRPCSCRIAFVSFVVIMSMNDSCATQWLFAAHNEFLSYVLLRLLVHILVIFYSRGLQVMIPLILRLDRRCGHPWMVHRNLCFFETASVPLRKNCLQCV